MMTQEERREVWQRKDHLTAQLANTTDKARREHLQTQIEACNQELISGKYCPPDAVESD